MRMLLVLQAARPVAHARPVPPVKRFDLATIDTVDVRAKMRDDGTLRFPGSPITRAGVFVYVRADGTERREYRPAEEVEKALATFDLAPVTLDHPYEFVRAGNASDHVVGAMAAPRIEDGHAVADVAIYAARAVDAVMGGMVELSCGFACDIEEAPGVTDTGEAYDVVQRNIIGNHLAIVYRGRVGTAHLKLDSLDACGPGLQAAAATQTKEATMTLETLKAELAAATEKLTSLAAQLQKAEGERDAAKATADAADKLRADAEAAVAGKASARAELLVTAARYKVADAAAKTDRDLKAAVVKVIDGTEIAADKSEDYVSAWFDAAVARADKSAASYGAIQIRGDKSDSDSATVAKMLAAANRYAAKETK